MRNPLLSWFHRAALQWVEYAAAVYAGVSGARARFPDPPDGDAACGKGRLAVRGGWRFLRLEGGPQERGRQHGALLGPLVPTVVEEYVRAICLLRGLSRAELVRRGRRMLPFIGEEYLEEMRGIADGACMAFEDVLLAHTFLEGVQGVACSCYAAWGSATRDGGMVFGRNLDFFSMGIAHRCQVVVFQKPDRGIPFLSVAWPGWCGTLTAVNTAGLCVGVLNVPGLVRKADMVGAPYAILFRRMVQEAATCDEALEILRGAARTFSNNVLIAQTRPCPRAVVAEYTARAVAVREARAGQDFIASTNHFRKLGRKAEWPDDAGYSRYPKIVSLLRAGRIGLRTPIFSRPRVALPNSLHTMIVCPARRAIRLSLGPMPAGRGRYREFQYGDEGIRWEEKRDLESNVGCWEGLAGAKVLAGAAPNAQRPPPAVSFSGERSG